MGDYYDYEEEEERERQEEEIQQLKDNADAQMREYYNNNPKAKASLNRTMLITFGVICAIILWDIHKRFLRVGLIATWIAVIGYGVIVGWNASLMMLV